MNMSDIALKDIQLQLNDILAGVERQKIERDNVLEELRIWKNSYYELEKINIDFINEIKQIRQQAFYAIEADDPNQRITHIINIINSCRKFE